MKFIKKKFVILTVLLMLIIISLFYLNNREQDQHKGELEESFKAYILTSLYSYAEETGDYDLKFGESKTITNVDKILELLRSEIQIGSKKFGPYINNSLDIINRQKKIKIIVYRTDKVLDVDIDNKDSVVILDKYER